MSHDYQYFLMISQKYGGWEDITHDFDDDDEPIDVICGNSDSESPQNFLFDYFIIHTFRGRAFFFQCSLDDESPKNGWRIGDPNLFIDHISCLYNYFFISADCKLIILSFDKSTYKVNFEAQIPLPSPVLKMKPASSPTIALFIHLQDYSLLMFRHYKIDNLFNIASNVLLFDVTGDTLVYVDNKLSQTKIEFSFSDQNESGISSIDHLKRLPYQLYYYNGENNESDPMVKRCIYEWNKGVLDLSCEDQSNPDIAKKNNNIIFSKCYIGNEIVYCDVSRSSLSLFNTHSSESETFFENDGQIIAFAELIGSKDVVVLKRQCVLYQKPTYYESNDIELAHTAMDSILNENGDSNAPVDTFFDVINIFDSLALIMKNDGSVLAQKSQNFVYLMYNLIKFQGKLVNTRHMAEILSFSFFDIALKAFQECEVAPSAHACLAILISKAIKYAPCRLSAYELCQLRTNKNFEQPLFMHPLRSQFNYIHIFVMDRIYQLREVFIIPTLEALMSNIRHTTCDLVYFAGVCHKYHILGKSENKDETLYLINRILNSANCISAEKLPDMVRILLFAYSWISINDKRSELPKKIVDFFEHIPENADQETMIMVQEVFEEYVSKLKVKIHELFDRVRFYPEDLIVKEIQEFVKAHIPYPSRLENIAQLFKKDIKNLAKSGEILRIKIEYINMIQDADDFIALCRSSHLARRTGNT